MISDWRTIYGAAIDPRQIIIEDGQVVPADARIISAYDNPNGWADFQKELERQAGQEEEHKGDEDEDNIGEKHGSGYALLAIDQSAMTGESLAVDKYVADVIYYTTGCKRGKAYAIVTHSAKMSFVGRTASLVSGAKDQGHFKAIMNSIGTSLLVLVVGWILAAWVGGFFHHLQLATPEWSSNSLLHYALILLIVGVPVGLPVVTTTTLAVGAAYLAKEKAIVQKLTAIESLAVSFPFVSFVPSKYSALTLPYTLRFIPCCAVRCGGLRCAGHVALSYSLGGSFGCWHSVCGRFPRLHKLCIIPSYPSPTMCIVCGRLLRPEHPLAERLHAKFKSK